MKTITVSYIPTEGETTAIDIQVPDAMDIAGFRAETISAISINKNSNKTTLEVPTEHLIDLVNIGNVKEGLQLLKPFGNIPSDWKA